jgi:hypothetical protein
MGGYGTVHLHRWKRLKIQRTPIDGCSNGLADDFQEADGMRQAKLDEGYQVSLFMQVTPLLSGLPRKSSPVGIGQG